MALDRVELNHRFDYHPPRDDRTITAHEATRTAARALADFIAETVPPGREQALALTAVEEAMMWANAGIARAGGPQ